MVISKYILNIDDIDFKDIPKIKYMVNSLNKDGKKQLFELIEEHFYKSIPSEEDISVYILNNYKCIVERLTENDCFESRFYKEDLNDLY